MLNEKEINKKLQYFAKEANDIITLFEQKNYSCSCIKKKEAQSRFKTLKEELKSEYQRMNTTKGQNNLSELELAFYQPAITDVWANSGISSIKWNSTPNTAWYSALYDVDDYMNYWQTLKIKN